MAHLSKNHEDMFKNLVTEFSPLHSGYTARNVAKINFTQTTEALPVV